MQVTQDVIDMKHLSRRFDEEILSPSLRTLFVEPIFEKSDDTDILTFQRLMPREVGVGTKPILAASLSPNTSRGVTFNQNQKPIENFEQILGGYDGGFEIGLQGVWKDFSALENFLQETKSKLLNKEFDGVIELNGRVWLLSVTSAYVGINY